MNSQLLIALMGMIAAFGGIATGIVALRRVGTENAVQIRSVAVTEADNTIEAQTKFIENLRADNANLRDENRLVRDENRVLRERLAGRDTHP